MIKHKTSRIQSVWCFNLKERVSVDVKMTDQGRKPAEASRPPFDGVVKQNGGSTWRHRTPVAMPMFPNNREGGGLCLVGAEPRCDR